MDRYISEGNQADQVLVLIEHGQSSNPVFSHNFSCFVGVLVVETTNGVPVHNLVNLDLPDVARIIGGTNNNITLGYGGDDLVTIANGKDIYV